MKGDDGFLISWFPLLFQMKKDQLKDQASSTAQSAKESCQQGQENTSNFMQQVFILK